MQFDSITITTSWLVPWSKVLPGDLWSLQRRRQPATKGRRGRVPRRANTHRADLQGLLNSRWYGWRSGDVIPRSSKAILVCYIGDSYGLAVGRFVRVSSMDHGRLLARSCVLDVTLFLSGYLVFSLVAKIWKKYWFCWSKSSWDLLESVSSIAAVFVAVSQDGDWNSGGVGSGRCAVESGGHGSRWWGGVRCGYAFRYTIVWI